METAKPLNVTRTTYRVADFLSWQRRGNLELRPPFQRGSVWSAKGEEVRVPDDCAMANVQRKIQSVDIDARRVARVGPVRNALPELR